MLVRSVCILYVSLDSYTWQEAIAELELQAQVLGKPEQEYRGTLDVIFKDLDTILCFILWLLVRMTAATWLYSRLFLSGVTIVEWRGRVQTTHGHAKLQTESKFFTVRKRETR